MWQPDGKGYNILYRDREERMLLPLKQKLWKAYNHIEAKYWFMKGKSTIGSSYDTVSLVCLVAGVSFRTGTSKDFLG